MYREHSNITKEISRIYKLIVFIIAVSNKLYSKLKHKKLTYG